MAALTGLERVYQKELKKPLQSLNRKKWMLPLAWFYTGFYLILAASIFFAVVIGLLPIIIKNKDATENLQPIAYSVIYLAIFGISIERILNSHKHKITALRESKWLPWAMAFLFSIIIFLAGWYVGVNYVAGPLNSDLLVRVGILMLGTVLLAIPYFAFVDFDEKFRNAYKTLAVGKTQNLLELSLEYNTQDRIASSSFAKSKLYPTEDFAHYNTSDKFVGRTEELRFEFCQVDTWEHRKIGNKIRIMPLFKGIFYRISFKGHFDGQTVWPNAEARSQRESLMSEVLSKSLGRTDISFSEITVNNSLVIYSTLTDEAKLYFTPAFVEAINSLKRQLNSDISVSLVDDSLFLAIPLTEDVFWPGAKANLDDYTQLEKHIEKVSELVKIAELGNFILDIKPPV